MDDRISRVLIATIAVLLLGFAAAVTAAETMLGEVELHAGSDAEKNAGVWVDGQYMGHLRELKGKNHLVLLPGEHELLVKLIGYRDLRDTIIVEPGQAREYRVTLSPDPNVLYPDESETARVRIEVSPETAAVFVDDVYAGHVDRFNGRKGARLSAGTHRFKITLPGYQPFETELRLIANQTYEIKTELSKASITEQSEELQVSRSGQ